MSSSFETTQRFFRPADAGRVRRNYRRVQIGRLLNVARNAVIVAGVVIGGIAAYQHVQSGSQFAVKHIMIDGAVHTPHGALDAITRQYTGANLFRIDIARVRRDLGSLPWVRHVDIEEKVPDTLRIRIAERVPAALVISDGDLRYVDEDGVTFAELSPAVGDADLPLIHVTTSDAPNADERAARTARPLADARGEIRRCVKLLHDVRISDPQLYARISEVSPIAPNGFAIFDREAGALVYASADDISAKWRDLRAILEAEKLTRGGIEYADLRFDGRVIVKPVTSTAAAWTPHATKEPDHAED